MQHKYYKLKILNISSESLAISSISFETLNIASRIFNFYFFLRIRILYGLVFINKVIFIICTGTPNSWMQVSQSEFIFLKDMWRLNFGGLMRFLPEVLNSLKIQTRFKVDLFLNFIIQNLERFWSLVKKKICSIWSNLSTCQILKFLELCKYQFLILQVRIIWIFEKSLD
jgi:hypothetical protein